MYEELIKQLRDNAEFLVKASSGYLSNSFAETMSQAADAIEELRDALLLMVLQYCATDDGLLYHSFMSAGENAFAVLGLENGQQADPLWDRVLIQKLPKEE